MSTPNQQLQQSPPPNSRGAYVAEIRKRVLRMYQEYCPEKVDSTDETLEKYRGHEEALMQALINKYGPEPGTLVRSVSASGGGGFGERSTTPGRRVQIANEGAPHPDRANASPVPRTRSLPPSSGDGRSPPQSPQQLPSNNSFGRRSGSIISVGADDGGGYMDDLSAIKKIVSNTGFLCPDHELRWEKAWLSKIPLNTICKESQQQGGGSGEILLEGWGYKYTAQNRTFQKWQKRYFIVIPPFVYYFEKDTLDAPCHGVIYMPRADVGETLNNNREAIQVDQQVMRKPMQIEKSGEHAPFFLSFDPPKTQAMWLLVLKRMAKMRFNLKTGALERGADGRARTMSMGPMSPMGGQGQGGGMQRSMSVMQQQQQQQQQRAMMMQQQAAPVVVEKAASPPEKKLPVSNEEMGKRIKRLAEDRDTEAINAILLNFISTKVTNSMDLWDLMTAVEEAEKKRPATPPQSSFASQQFASFMGSPQMLQPQQQQFQSFSAGSPLLRGMSGVLDTQSVNGAPTESGTATGSVAVVAPVVPTATATSTTQVNEAKKDDAIKKELSATLPPQNSISTTGATPPPQQQQPTSEVQALREQQVQMQKDFQSQMEAMMRNQQQLVQQLSFQQQQQPQQPGFARSPAPAMGAMLTADSSSPYSVQPQSQSPLQQQQRPQHDDGLDDILNNVKSSPSMVHRGGPSYADPALMQQQQQQLYASPMNNNNPNGGASPSPTMQSRLDRSRNRKALINQMLNDLPK